MLPGDGLGMVVDLDGVVFDFDRGWTTRHRDQFLWSEAAPGLTQEWDQLHLIAGFATREEFWEWFFDTGGFTGMPLYPGARDALWMADSRGWFIVYATNRPTPDTVTAKELVRAGLPAAHRLHHTQAKWEVPGDLYLEDAPGNITAMLSMGCRVVPVERPWNQSLLAGFDPDATIPGLTRDTLLPWLVGVERLDGAGRVPQGGT